MKRAAFLATGILILVAAAPAVRAVPPDPIPNVLYIMSDDYPWGYYTKMRDLNGTVCTNADGSTCTSGCSYCTPTQHSGFELPVFDDPGTYDFATPGLDALAARGAIFPVGHAGASFCHPSFQATLTGLYEKDFLNGRKNRPKIASYPHKTHVDTLPNGNPYYVVEYLNEALADAVSNAQGNPPANPPRYRSLGFAKIWTKGSFQAAGFDFGWKGLLKGRATIKPVIDFILDNRVLVDDPDTPEDDRNVPYSAFCADKRAECPSAADRTNPNNAHKYDKARPWFVWFATDFPHYPKDGGARVDKRLRYEAGEGTCNPADFVSTCIELPPTCTGAQGLDGPNCGLKELKERMDDLDEVEHSKYLQNILLFDYWVDQLQKFLDDPTPAANDSLDENTIVTYQADNGYIYENSKKANAENAYRTPIMISWPGSGANPIIPTGTRPQMVNAIDFLPTLVDYATGEKFLECPLEHAPTPDRTPGPGVAGTVFPPMTTKECSLQSQQDIAHCGCLPGKSMRQLFQPTPTGQRAFMVGQNSNGGVYLRTATGLRLKRNRECGFSLHDVKVDFDENDNCLSGFGACSQYAGKNWAAGECGTVACPSCASANCGADTACNDVRSWQCALQRWSVNTTAACDRTDN